MTPPSPFASTRHTLRIPVVNFHNLAALPQGGEKERKKNKDRLGGTRVIRSPFAAVTYTPNWQMKGLPCWRAIGAQDKGAQTPCHRASHPSNNRPGRYRPRATRPPHLPRLRHYTGLIASCYVVRYPLTPHSRAGLIELFSGSISSLRYQVPGRDLDLDLLARPGLMMMVVVVVVVAG